MKKILLASTALVAAGLIGSGAAEAADKIKINVGGFSKWWVVGAFNSTDYQNAINNTYSGSVALGSGSSLINGRPKYVNADVKGDNEIWFSGDTTLDNGLKVGVFVSMEAGGHSDITTDVIDASYAWIAGGFGKVLIGTAPNGTALLHVQAPDAASNWGAGGVMTGNFAIVRPSSVMGQGQRVGYSSSTNTTAIVDDNKAEKLTYVAPTFYGLTAGASYVPSVLREDIRSTPTRGASAYGAGALYAETFGPVGVKVSAGYVYVNLGSVTGNNETNLSIQSYGTQLSYAGFTLGGSFKATDDNYNQQNGRSGRWLGPVTGGNNNGNLGNAAIGGTDYYSSGKYWVNGTDISGKCGAGAGAGGGQNGCSYGGYAYDVGLSYASGPYAVSFDYFFAGTKGMATAKKGAMDEITFYQASGKYNLGPGVDVLASAGWADYRDQRKGQGYTCTAGGGTNTSCDGGFENSGFVAMTGLSLAF